MSERLAPDAPYAEKWDSQAGRFDAALLNAWGRICPRVPHGLQRRRLSKIAHKAESREKELCGHSDQRLLEISDGLRATLRGANFRPDAVAFAFALAAEAVRRHIGIKLHHVQYVGAAAMMNGALAEMQTGEGKTLTAFLPAVTAGLAGQATHVITVNDYLARRDAEHLRPVFGAFGLSVGLVVQGQAPEERRAAYACDVTYCTNKEIVFDYLRDRLAMGRQRAPARRLVGDLLRSDAAAPRQPLLLRGLDFAIVDEADSILIDEARTPLILSGAEEDRDDETSRYTVALDIARQLNLGDDFHLEAKRGAVRLTPSGDAHLRELAAGRSGIWAIRRARDELVQHALCALHLYRRDAQYIVAEGKIQIVDEFTGRVMPDRSWERGLHQMIESKEDCELTERRQTLARITYQRFFRRYLHLCGMTGTAIEAAGELRAVYDLKVIRIPTNLPLRRRNLGTRIFANENQKWSAVVAATQAFVREGRAVLIGTRSVEASELIGDLLSKAALQPVILNARQDKQEADIVARAGQPGAVTVATNMAGRGTDILLHPDVRASGGLHVILTEFHEAGRIDRQLFGRAGRQGDQGSFESIVAMSDELFQRFGGRNLLWMVQSGAKLAGGADVLLLRILRRHCQAAAERLHARARRLALTEDYRAQKSLSFSGLAE